MKKILMLGGSMQQIVAIKTAQKLGYRTILCDYLPNNPGQFEADIFYRVSTTDKEAVLSVARKEHIDGIVAYASDPAAPTAAFVAEKLNLPTNPYDSVEILSNKDLFRKFLSENNFNTPFAMGFCTYKEAFEKLALFKFPVLVKPIDSSGSKGITVVYDENHIKDSVEYALSFSRAKRFIIEEFVEKYGYQVAGDGFVVDGKLVFRAFGNDHFDSNLQDCLVPVAASFPYNMPQEIHDKIHDEVQRALSLLKMKMGAFNFDIRIDRDMNVYLMEIGPRNGGNMIPDVIKYLTGFNMAEYTIKAAMGEDCKDIQMYSSNGFWAYYSLHSGKKGIFKELIFDEDFKRNNLVELHVNKNKGDFVCEYTGANTNVGIMILKFENMDEMLTKIDNMNDHVKIVLE